MMPMLRFFRHGDGNFALFNGMGPTQTDLLTTILAYDDARGAPLANAPHSGYQRLESAGTLVLMDTGRASADAGEPGGPCRLPVVRALGQAKPDRGQLRIAVDQPRRLAAGGARDRGAFHRHAQRYVVVPFRRTPGRSSACSFGTPDDRRSRQVTVVREEQPDGVLLRASHDGYADIFNVVHQRVLVLSTDGRRLDGEDLFTPASGQAMPADRDQFALRFHLHPSIKANRVADGHSAMLLLPNKEAWIFNAYDDPVDLEESVYLAGPDGPRRTLQTRHLWPRPQGHARAMDVRRASCGRHRRRGPPPPARG